MNDQVIIFKDKYYFIPPFQQKEHLGRDILVILSPEKEVIQHQPDNGQVIGPISYRFPDNFSAWDRTRHIEGVIALPIIKECPIDGYQLGNYCTECGRPLVFIDCYQPKTYGFKPKGNCPNCGVELDSNVHYCLNCGSQFNWV